MAAKLVNRATFFSSLDQATRDVIADAMEEERYQWTD